jgi:hypothetical protein
MLDLDLDAFVNDVAHFKSGEKRLSPKWYRRWEKRRVRDFLEQQCGLSKEQPIPGRFAIEHDAAFDYWKEIVRGTGETLDVVHVDGHADLGWGNSSWVNLLQDYLWRPVSERYEPLRGLGFMNPGSYLAYAIAARFVSSVVYIYPHGGRSDIPDIYFRGNNPASGFIELKAFSPEAMQTLQFEKLTAEAASIIEPAVPFSHMPIKQFRAAEPFQAGFLCQSPWFTPRKSDELISVIGEYIRFEPE